MNRIAEIEAWIPLCDEATADMMCYLLAVAKAAEAVKNDCEDLVIKEAARGRLPITLGDTRPFIALRKALAGEK